MKVLFSRFGGNGKLGPMPVSTVEEGSCPPSCPLKGNGCYAEYGPVHWHWRKVGTNPMAVDWDGYRHLVAALPRGTAWRHAQAGDLAGENDRLDKEACLALAKANEGRKGFGYTHYPVLATDEGPSPVSKATAEHNLEVLRQVNALGMLVRLSADNLEEADQMKATGLPVAVLLPVKHGKGKVKEYEGEPLVTEGGNKVVVCPHYTRGVQCIDCGLCFSPKFKAIVGFPAHGGGRLKASRVFGTK